MDINRERHFVNDMLEQLNRNTDNLLLKLDNYEQAVLDTPVSPGVWSVMQVLSHVRLSEKLSLAYIKKKLSFQPVLKKAGLKSKIRFWLLKFYVGSRLKFKAPRGVSSEALPVSCSLSEIRSVWGNERKALSDFIHELDDSLLDKELYKHPVVGKLTPGQMLHFFNLHFQRHEQQINRRLPR